MWSAFWINGQVLSDHSARLSKDKSSRQANCIAVFLFRIVCISGVGQAAPSAMGNQLALVARMRQTFLPMDNSFCNGPRREQFWFLCGGSPPTTTATTPTPTTVATTPTILTETTTKVKVSKKVRTRRRGGCALLRKTLTIAKEGCEDTMVEVNTCGGKCSSKMLPKAVPAVGVGKGLVMFDKKCECCQPTSVYRIEVFLNCRGGLTRREVLSAEDCACHSCEVWTG